MNKGWELSPVYDINPDFAKGHALMIDNYSNESSLDNLFNAHKDYHLSEDVAYGVIKDVINAMTLWWDRRNADLRYVLNSWQYDKYVALSHFYRPVAWKAGSWTFAVYSHYNRGHFYNDRPTVFVTYKGGNNRRDVRFYADRKVTRPAVHHANNVPAKVNKSSNGSTWRNTGNTSRPATTTKPIGHSNGNRQIAMNTNNNRSGSGHFGGRR